MEEQNPTEVPKSLKAPGEQSHNCCPSHPYIKVLQFRFVLFVVQSVPNWYN